jgi:hypothetical protein
MKTTIVQDATPNPNNRGSECPERRIQKKNKSSQREMGNIVMS